ncbi:MAG: hypothetical protein J6Z31_10555 [Fibrobacter sp.]|nr:hypothetical protein [Fibrobacter sp.]
MKRIFRILAALIVTSACVFADAPDSIQVVQKTDSQSAINRWVEFGVVLDGAYGQWNEKLHVDHLSAQQFGFGVSGLVGFDYFALRLSALGKYKAMYVSEGSQATINEGFWRLGGGVAARFQSGKQKGIWAELGTAALVSLQDKIALCESKEQNIYWGIESKVEVPLELSAGYRFALGSVSLETALFGSYDLTSPATFVVNDRKHEARAWNVGARVILWAVRL